MLSSPTNHCASILTAVIDRVTTIDRDSIDTTLWLFVGIAVVFVLDRMCLCYVRRWIVAVVVDDAVAVVDVVLAPEMVPVTLVPDDGVLNVLSNELSE